MCFRIGCTRHCVIVGDSSAPGTKRIGQVFGQRRLNRDHPTATSLPDGIVLGWQLKGSQRIHVNLEGLGAPLTYKSARVVIS